MVQLREEHQILEPCIIEPEAVKHALTEFQPLWQSLSPKEQIEVFQLLIERVDYDGNAGTVSVTFHPNGFEQFLQTQTHEEIPA